MSTGEAARLLGVSRQHVADLCDRGELPSVRVGAHRRVPRAEIESLASGALTHEQEKSLWLHRALLTGVMTDDGVLAAARDNLERWRPLQRTDGMTAGYLRQWALVLDGGVDAVLEVLTSRSPRSCELRQNSPFAGALPDDVRRTVLRAFDEHWTSTHRHLEPVA